MFATPQQRSFMILSCAFIVVFCCFSATNFLTPRYMLAAIVPLMFFCAVAFDFFIQRIWPLLFFAVLGVIFEIAAFTFYTNTGFGDVDMGAFDGLAVQQGVVDYMEQHTYYDSTIGGGSFLENQHLMTSATGFLRSEKKFTHIRWDIDDHTDYAIFDNMEPDPRYDAVRKSHAFHLQQRIEKGRVWAEIWAHN
jgi:hypothetical protein